MKRIKIIGITFAVLYIMGCAPTNRKVNLEYLKSEENLRSRVELVNKYMNERKFEKIIRELKYSEEKKTKKDIEIEAEAWAREATFFLKFEFKIDRIKIIGDRGYVFTEITYFNPLEPPWKEREMSIWIFKIDNWYLKDVNHLVGDTCKEPIIIYNIFIEEITPETIIISWETDEECASEIRIGYYSSLFYLGKIEEWIFEPSIKKIHKIRFGRKKKEGKIIGEGYDIKILAKKGERICYSPTYNFNIQEILSSKVIPKRLD